MRYVIKQKLLTLSADFSIKNEAGNDVFTVKGKVLSIGKKLSMFDMQGNEKCNIQQKLLKLLAEYDLSVDSQTVMNIKQKFTVIGKKFDITGSAGEYSVEGNFLAMDFRILKKGVVVATISKKILAVADTYTVDIDDKENQALMLSVAIVLDMICNNGK